MKMKTKLISSLVLLLMANNYSYAYDLAYAYKEALEYNAEYLKAVANNLAGKENKIIARSSLLPQISATAGANENYLSQAGGYQLSVSPSVGASLNQVLFDFSQFSKYTKAKYETEIANLELSNAKQKLLVTISKAYFDVLYAKDTLLAVQKNKEALLEQQKQAKRSFELGVNTIADVNEAQAGYDKAEADEITAINDLINRKTIFHNLTGLNPEQILPLREKYTSLFLFLS